MKKIAIPAILVVVSVYGYVPGATIKDRLAPNHIAILSKNPRNDLASPLSNVIFYKNEKIKTSYAVPGGVTNIKEVVNRTPHTIELRKWDTPWGGAAPNYETTGPIPANGVYSGAMWIPWANNADEFSEHAMEIKVNGNAIAQIWQSGEYVRSKRSAERFSSNAPRIPGASLAGGDRKLVVAMSNNQTVFTLTGY